MSGYRQRLGRQAEELAARYLERAGYQILRRNWRCPAGEVDIVARQGDTLVLMEVRARTSRAFGMPEESLTAEKRATLLACGQYLTATLGWDKAWRIDVIAIETGASAPGGTTSIRLITNAVEE